MTQHKNGVELIKLFGFQETKDESGEIILRMNTQVSVTFVKGRKLEYE